MDKQIIVAGNSNDALYFSFYVEDGDGDIGGKDGNFVFKDSRDGTETSFDVPTIPDEYSPDKGIRGNIVVAYNAAWLKLREDTNHLAFDTLSWDVFLEDKAGNKSNVATTTPLILKK